MIVAVVTLVLLVVVALAVVVSYNRFARQQHQVEEAWRQVEVELVRRHDLVPNVVAVVEATARHERATLLALTEAQERAVRARGRSAQAAAEATVSGRVTQVLMLAENYPQLGSDATFLDLAHQLTECEDRLAASRRFYNGSVRALNARLSTIPSALVGSIFHVQQAEYFEAPAPATAAPDLRALRGREQ